MLMWKWNIRCVPVFFKENLFLNKVQEEPDGSRGCIKEPLHNTTNVQSVYFLNQSWSPYGTDKPE